MTLDKTSVRRASTTGRCGKIIANSGGQSPMAAEALGRFRRERTRRIVRAVHEVLECRRLFSGYSISVLANLDATTGVDPYGGIVMDSAGNLYGASGYGDGTIFEFSKSMGYATLLATFNGTDGAQPAGRLLLDSSGNLYGTTMTGGADQAGTVFELANGSSSITTLATFNGINGSKPLAGLIADSAGNLYGTTYGGGANSNGTVFEVAVGSGVITTLASDGPASAGLASSGPTSELVMDSGGNLYGTAIQGGDAGDGSIFEVANGSGVMTTLVAFNGSNGEFPGALTIDSAGNLYGTTASAEFTVFKLAIGSGAITTLANLGDTSPNSPLLMDSGGDLFGTSVGGYVDNGGMVFELVNGSSMITTLGGFNVTNGYGPSGALAMDSAGNIYGATEDGGIEISPSILGGGVLYEVSSRPVAPPPHLAFTAQPVGGSIGAPIHSIAVSIKDANGNIVATDNSTVTLTIASGPAGASFEGPVSAMLVHGVATFSVDFGQPGTYSLTATDGSLSVTSMPFTMVQTPTQLAFNSPPSIAVAGAMLDPITVQVEDAFGNVVAANHSTVTLTISAGPPGAMLYGAISAPVVNGVATFNNVALDPAGIYTLTAIDGSLTAASAGPFDVLAPLFQSSIVPTFRKINLPSMAVVGSTFNAKVSVLIASSGKTTSGDVIINLYADQGKALAGNQALIASLTKYVSLRAGQRRIVHFAVKSLPPTIAPGTYHFLAETVDPSGATSVTATTQVVQIAAPMVRPSILIGDVTPSNIKSGRSGSVLVTITNDGNVAATGVDITLSPSNDGSSPVTGIILEYIDNDAVIQPNRSKTFTLNFIAPSALAAGSYFPYIAISLGNVSTTASGIVSFNVPH